MYISCLFKSKLLKTAFAGFFKLLLPHPPEIFLLTNQCTQSSSFLLPLRHRTATHFSKPFATSPFCRCSFLLLPPVSPRHVTCYWNLITYTSDISLVSFPSPLYHHHLRADPEEHLNNSAHLLIGLPPFSLILLKSIHYITDRVSFEECKPDHVTFMLKS